MNFDGTGKLLVASLMLLLSATRVNFSQTPPATPAQTIIKAAQEVAKEVQPAIRKLELIEKEQDRRLDSLESRLDSTAVVLQKSSEEKKITEVVLDETSTIQQSVIHLKIPILLMQIKQPASSPVRMRVRLVTNPKEFKTNPRPVSLPEVETPCPEKRSIFKRVFKRHHR